VKAQRTARLDQAGQGGFRCWYFARTMFGNMDGSLQGNSLIQRRWPCRSHHNTQCLPLRSFGQSWPARGDRLQHIMVHHEMQLIMLGIISLSNQATAYVIILLGKKSDAFLKRLPQPQNSHDLLL